MKPYSIYQNNVPKKQPLAGRKEYLVKFRTPFSQRIAFRGKAYEIFEGQNTFEGTSTTAHTILTMTIKPNISAPSAYMPRTCACPKGLLARAT